jgi:hypothetical protein
VAANTRHTQTTETHQRRPIAFVNMHCTGHCLHRLQGAQPKVAPVDTLAQPLPHTELHTLSLRALKGLEGLEWVQLCLPAELAIETSTSQESSSSCRQTHTIYLSTHTQLTGGMKPSWAAQHLIQSNFHGNRAGGSRRMLSVQSLQSCRKSNLKRHRHHHN